MSRSGYSDDCEHLAMWRGQVASAIRGKRGQAFLREMLEALDALPEKRLIADNLIDSGGGVCAIGSVGLRRGVDMSTLDPQDQETIAHKFGIARQLAAEIAYENDEAGWNDTPEKRFERVRAWVIDQIKEA